jgi:hypothetical protein
MTEFNEPRLLANWLDAHPGEAPPAGIEAEVVQAVYALRPDLAPAPRVSLDDILGGVRAGPFAPTDTASADAAPADAVPAFGAVPAHTDSDEPQPAFGGHGAPEFALGSDLDEVDPITADIDPEATPVVGVNTTDPVIEPVEGETDPGLLPIDHDIEGEQTSPSGRAPSFGIVDAPPAPELAKAEPPPSLRNRAVTGPTKLPTNLSSAGLPTGPPTSVAPDDDTDIPTPVDESEQATDPGVTPMAEVVDLTAHPRWRGRRLWAMAGTVATAAIVLFAVVPNQTLQDMALAPGRMAADATPVASPAPETAAPRPESATALVADGFRPDQRLDRSTRAADNKADARRTRDLNRSASDKEERSEHAGGEKKKAGAADAPMNQATAKQAPLTESEPPADVAGTAGPPREAEELAAAEDHWDEVPDAAFLDIAEEQAMDFDDAGTPTAPSLSGTSKAEGDWGIASEPTRRKSSDSRLFTTSDEFAERGNREGGLGTLTEANPGTGPRAPSPHEMDALRAAARPMDYRSDWYLLTANFPEATRERIRKTLQEADADTRLDDYTHAASVVARLVDEKDGRVAQDFAGRAAAWYLEAGDPVAAIEIIGRGKARGSANSPYLSRLHYLEGKALERQGKDGWAAESYRAAGTLNAAR